MPTLQEYRAKIASDSAFKNRSSKQWEYEIQRHGIHVCFDEVLNTVEKQYVEKLTKIEEALSGGIQAEVRVYDGEGRLREAKDIGLEVMEAIQSHHQKKLRLLEKLACVTKEKELRAAKLVTREPHHTDYYIDFTNGNDARTGLKSANLTVDSCSDTLHITDADLTGADDYINGAYVWNVTRVAGAYVSDFDAASDTITLSGAIAGMAAGDTYYYIDAWKTINKYTTTTTRTAGDRAFVRANQTHTTTADIVMDESGDVDTWIKLIGCDSSVNDPWHDGSSVKPIVDFGDAAYQVYLNNDNFWWFERIVFQQSSDVYSGVYIYGVYTGYFKDCSFLDCVSVPTVRTQQTYRIVFDGCYFADAGSTTQVAFVNFQSEVTFQSCTFDAGSLRGGRYGLYVAGSTVCIRDCVFAPTNTFGYSCIAAPEGAVIYGSNITHSGTWMYAAGSARQGYYYGEDHGSFGNQLQEHYVGIITKETSSPRSGGATSYARITTNAYCGMVRPIIFGDTLTGNQPILLTADVQKTITVYARTSTAWASALTSGEAFLRVSYLSNASTSARTIVESSQTITNDANWTAFTVTITPARTGLAYWWFILGEYESSKYIDVDPIPVVS